MTTYLATTGIYYENDSKYVEAGDFVTDLPEASISWLLKSGIIEEYVAPEVEVEDNPAPAPGLTNPINPIKAGEEIPVTDALPVADVPPPPTPDPTPDPTPESHPGFLDKLLGKDS